MAADDLEFAGGQRAGLVEDGRGHGELADVVQKPAERDDLQLPLGIAAEVAEHRREHGDVDRMGERVGVVQADVRDLHEVLLLRHDVAHEEIGALFQAGHVETTVLFRLAEGFRHVVDGLHARAFLDDVGRRLQLKVGGKRGDVQFGDAELAQPIDVAIGQRRAAHEEGGAFLIEDALRRHHAGLELIRFQAYHGENTPVSVVEHFEMPLCFILRFWATCLLSLRFLGGRWPDRH